MVRVEGLEPPRLAALEPKSSASTNFATPALSGGLAKPRAGFQRKMHTSGMHRNTHKVCPKG